MERTKERSSFRKKFIGDRKFYMMVLAVAVPIMIQNGITNFVSLLDNIMIGRIGTEQMSGASIVICAFSEGCPERVFSRRSILDRRITRV